MIDETTRDVLFDLLFTELCALRDDALEAGAEPPAVRAELRRREVLLRNDRGPAPVTRRG